MAADVGSLLQILNRYNGNELNSNENVKTKTLVTRDLLGGCCKLGLGSDELDLDLHVPQGWEKKLDIESGKISLQKCNSSITTESKYRSMNNNFHDLNFPPPITEESLDLKLVNTTRNYQSVCTLDKVKLALERAEKQDIGKRRIKFSNQSPSCSSSSTTSFKTGGEDEEIEEISEMFAAGCPSCLLYVLISKRNPKCPRCNSIVPSPLLKKQRIDLNLSFEVGKSIQN